MSFHGKVIDRDRGWRAMIKAVDALAGGNSYAKVGVLADDSKGGAHVDDTEELTEAELAGILEFGTSDGRIPERSFVRSTFDEQREVLTDMGAKLLFQIIEGKISLGNALNAMGAKLAAEIKKKVTVEGVPPPNAESTIEAKGSDRPLVDTGRMINAVTWQLVLSNVAKALASEGHGRPGTD